jgi:hypothetical protein
MPGTRSIPELSVDVQVLMKHLQQVAIGETVTYDSLSSLIRRDVQRAARHLLDSARNRLERDEHVLFAPVIGVGLKRLDDVGVVATGQRGIQHIRRAARKVTRRLTQCVQHYDQLPAEQQRTHNLALAQAGVLAHMTQSGVEKRIASKVPDVASTVPARFLEAVKETL